MDLSNLYIKNLNHLGLVDGLCQEVDVAEIIDKLILSSALEGYQKLDDEFLCVRTYLYL